MVYFTLIHSFLTTGQAGAEGFERGSDADFRRFLFIAPWNIKLAVVIRKIIPLCISPITGENNRIKPLTFSPA